tara:strand:+ start:359 stop:688 length:330 start_codon:yes stop_codon:yes gene_type:complete
MSNKTALKRARKKKEQARLTAKGRDNPSGSGGLARKVKRKAFAGARKQFMKDFKSKMASFKKQVKCVECDRQPAEGENIDDWHVNKYSENIDLVCTSCYDKEESEELDE